MQTRAGRPAGRFEPALFLIIEASWADSPGARALDDLPAGRVLAGRGLRVAKGDTRAAPALVTKRLPEGGQPGGPGGIAVVPSGDRDGAGHAAAGADRGAEGSEGEFVAHRGDRVGRVIAAEQFFGEGFAVRGGVA